jgi:hypothetical protein
MSLMLVILILGVIQRSVNLEQENFSGYSQMADLPIKLLILMQQGF